MADEKQNERMEKLVSLCKRRGFIFPASEIYGGLNGFWDYGPMGAELKRNIKNAWWHDMVIDRPIGPDGQEVSIVGLDSAIIQNPRTWEASGHLAGFTDPMVDCKECKARFRADQVFVLGWISEPELRRFNEEVRVLFIPEGESLSQIDTEEVERLLKHEVRRAPKPYLKSVVASEAGEAERNCKLSSREAKHLGKTFPMKPYRLTDFVVTFANRLPPAPCPGCGKEGCLTSPRQFNMMFKTFVGASEDSASAAYLRPETAQGIFNNYLNVLNTSRVKVPFGIAQVGKAFRNEINPRNYTFRSREFEQMELEFFVPPDKGREWYEFWRSQRIEWYKKHGLRSDHLRPREQGKDELAHYSSACTDIEYLFPFSDEPQELEGVAHRGCYDLSRHQEFSGKDMSFFDDEAWLADQPKFADKSKEEQTKIKNAEPYRYIPHVIEPSAGVDRFTLAVLCEAYTEDQAPDEKGVMQTRVVMKIHPRLAPIKVAVFPLVRKDGMPEIATELYGRLKRRWVCDYDEKSAVGRRYRRHDEIGTPFCVTVDGQTKEDGTVTIRERDSMTQTRVKLEETEAWIAERLTV
ncbi:MAG: Glycine--tRNA ligase [Phycisphaerae bacterium]|nr:Glycine--tRNA ligase [Phycisphaerae bacterium]